MNRAKYAGGAICQGSPGHGVRARVRPGAMLAVLTALGEVESATADEILPEVEDFFRQNGNPLRALGRYLSVELTAHGWVESFGPSPVRFRISVLGRCWVEEQRASR